MVLERSWSAVLITPTMPEAGSMCPMLVFTEPTTSGSSWVWDFANTLLMAPSSMGSPSGVPVPCASTYWIWSGVSPAAARAWPMTSSWAGPCGTVSPALSPSWPIAVPRIRATMLSPSRWASDRRLRTSTPQPSARE